MVDGKDFKDENCNKYYYNYYFCHLIICVYVVAIVEGEPR